MSEENAQPDPKELVQQILEAGKGSELLEMLKNALNEDDPAKQKVHPRAISPKVILRVSERLSQSLATRWQTTLVT